MKKLMLLGGAQYLLPVIAEAKKLGIYTISCDYLPDNVDINILTNTAMSPSSTRRQCWRLHSGWRSTV